MFLRLIAIMVLTWWSVLPGKAGAMLRVDPGHDHPALLTSVGNSPSHAHRWHNPKDVYSEFKSLDPDDCSQNSAARDSECAELETGSKAIRTPRYFTGDQQGEGQLPVARRTYPTNREQPNVTPVRRGAGLPEMPSYDQDKIDERFLRGMTAQLLLVTFEGQAPPQAGLVKVLRYLKDGDVGGALIRSQNVSGANQLKALSGLLSSRSRFTPLVMIGRPGASSRESSPKPGFSLFPAPREIGNKGDALEAFNVYQRMAKELAKSGISMNIGPLADICHTDALDSEDICYGSHAPHAAAFASAFVFAHQEQKVLSALRIRAGRASMKSLQMFNLVLNRRAPDAVYIDLHDTGGKVTDGTVETQTFLRQSGFNGAIIHTRPDALSAGQTAEALIDTLKSGADMLLFKPSDDWSLRIVVDKLKLASSSDPLLQSRIREAFETVYRMNLLRRQWHFEAPGVAADATSSVYRRTVR